MFITESDDNDFMKAVKRQAQSYFQRGMAAAAKNQKIRTFDELADIIEVHLLKNGLDELWAETLALVFARSYMGGIAAIQSRKELTV